MKKIGNWPITEADTDFSKISTKNQVSERFQEVLRQAELALWDPPNIELQCQRVRS